jgi:hypothetical protein
MQALELTICLKLGMAILPAGAGIRGYPTRRARIRADIFTRGRGFGRTFLPAGS